MFSLALHRQSLNRPMSAPPTPQEKRDAVVRDLALLTIALGVATLVLANLINHSPHLHPAYALGTFGAMLMAGWVTKIVDNMPVNSVDTDRKMQ